MAKNETIWMSPDATAEVEFIVRRLAAAQGQQVMPRRPFPWNRAVVRVLEKQNA